MHFLRRLNFALFYLSNPPWDSGISPPELLDFIAQHQAGRAIDLGCGTGTNAITLAQAGWQVTGVDFIPRAIRTAKRKCKAANVQADLRVSDVTNLHGISGPFNLALDMGCFHGLGDKKAAYLSELERILAPGGHWLLYVFFNPDTSTGSGQHPPHPRPGLAEADMSLIPTSMNLIWREDGFDKRERPSAWFLFQKAISLA